MQATYVRGEYITVPHTASGAITAGDVVVENGIVMIAHQDIASGAIGTMAIGGGVYDFIATSGDVVDRFDSLYWDDSGNNAEESATSNTLIGPCLVAKASGETTIRALHLLRTSTALL